MHPSFQPAPLCAPLESATWWLKKLAECRKRKEKITNNYHGIKSHKNDDLCTLKKQTKMHFIFVLGPNFRNITFHLATNRDGNAAAACRQSSRQDRVEFASTSSSISLCSGANLQPGPETQTTRGGATLRKKLINEPRLPQITAPVGCRNNGRDGQRRAEAAGATFVALIGIRADPRQSQRSGTTSRGAERTRLQPDPALCRSSNICHLSDSPVQLLGFERLAVFRPVSNFDTGVKL